MSERKSLLKVSGLLMASRGAGWILGFLREMTVAALYGTSRIVDIFAVAIIIPNSVFNLLNSALSSSLIPHYVALKAEHGEDTANRFIRALTGQLSLIVFLLTATAMLFATEIVASLAPAFQAAELSRAALFLKLVLPAAPFIALFLLLQNVYQIHDRWTLPALGPVVSNSTAIAVLLMGFYWFGENSLPLSWAISFVLLPFMLYLGRTGRKFIRPAISGVGTGSYYKLMLPLVLASLLAIAVQVVNRYLAAKLPAGELSSFVYAQRIYIMCGELVMATIIPALFPRLAESAVASDRQAYHDLLEKALLGVSIITIGGAALLGGLARPVVELAFQRGAFVASDTLRVAGILTVLAGSLTFYVPMLVLYRTFFAERNTIVPMLAMLSTTSIDIGLCFILIGPMGTPGMAVASLTAMAIQVILLVVVAPRFGVVLPRGKFIRMYLTGLPLAIAIAVLLRYSDVMLGQWNDSMSLIWRISKLGLLGVIGLAVYFLGCRLLFIPGSNLMEQQIKAVWQHVRPSKPDSHASA